MSFRLLDSFGLYDPSIGYVSYTALRKEADIGSAFITNYNQMKIIAEKNHGKVFEQVGDRVYLWENVKDVEYANQSNFDTSRDITLYAVWKEPKTVTYKVQHYKQITSLGNNYELVSGDTQNLSGKTGELTQAPLKLIQALQLRHFHK